MAVFFDENMVTVEDDNGDYKQYRFDEVELMECTGLQDKNVLRDIAKITDPKSGLSTEFAQLNFEPTSYTDGWNRKQKAYAMTRDGFTMLVMGYTM